MKTKSKNKIVIIGTGFVGSTIAYSLMLSEFVSEIVLIDINTKKAMGEVMDMNHGLSYVKQMVIRTGDYQDCADADVIVITAGVNRKPGQSRLDLAKVNVSILNGIVAEITKYITDAVVLVVTNPVDILTYAAYKFSGLPRTRILGTGTTLDTARFKYLISKHCDVDVTNVHAYIIGEHGDSEVPVWSRANIAGKKFDEFCIDCPKQCGQVQRDKIFEDVKLAGANIIEMKGATYYGIALAVRRILKAILFNENSILTVSSVVNGNYGIYDVAISLPSVIGSDGIERIFDIGIDERERKMLYESAEKLKEVLKQVL